MKQSILIVHKDGNISSNPNLSAIARTLKDSGFQLDVLSVRNRRSGQESTADYRLWHARNFSCFIRDNALAKWLKPFRSYVLRRIGAHYDLVIGVDSEGIAFAGAISLVANIPLMFISYEIMFRDEADFDFKGQEIDACKRAAFTVCQDPVRSQKLSEENDIPLDSIINVPVAGSNQAYPEGAGDYLRHRFGIEINRKIALYMGAIDEWAGQKVLFASLDNWPQDWVLVVHGKDRHGHLEKCLGGLSPGAREKVYLSDEPFQTFADLYQLPLSADLGIALYYPDWRNPETGKNVKYIGWSSGKVATYFQCGLPAVVNEIGEISADVQENRLGYVLRGNETIADILHKIRPVDLLERQTNCRDFFKAKLDFNNYKGEFLGRINALLCSAPNDRSCGATELPISLMNTYFWVSGELVYLFRFKCVRYHKKLLHLLGRS